MKEKILHSTYTKIIFAVIAVASIAAVLVMFIRPGNKIASGIRANGISIGGLTKDEAAAKLEEKFLDDTVVKITSGGSEKEFSGADIELKRDISATIDAAYELGRGKDFFENAGFLISARLHGKNIDYKLTCSRENLEKILYDFGVSINGELHNYVLDFSGDYVNVKRGSDGQSTDVSQAVEEVISSLNQNIYEIPVTLAKTAPPEPDSESLAAELYIAPVDASYEIADGKVVFKQEQYGRQIDKIEAGTQIDKLKNGETITLKLIKTAPKVTMADLNAQLFSYELGKYSTVYAQSNKNRSANVSLAASKLNGIVLAPDEVFSYNGTIGKRSSENGFKEAQIYENGEVVQGLGGGVCQVSSTLYSAALYADLKIISRQAHSMTVGYVPKGQDATVSYGTIDFKFKNDTAYPIKIAAEAVNGKINISVWGTAPEKQKTVKIQNTVVETKEPTIEEVPDQTLPTGEKKVISKGKTGYTVETVRKVYVNGAEIKSEKMSGSVYKMVPTKVAIGAKVPAPLPTLPPLASPEPAPEAETQGDGE